MIRGFCVKALFASTFAASALDAQIHPSHGDKSAAPNPAARPVLAALLSHIERAISAQRIAPEFVVFADKFTATALEGWHTGKSWRSAPIGSEVVCPWSKAQGLGGYSLRVQLESLVDDIAMARYEIRCAKGHRGAFVTGGLFQLQLRNGQWVVGRVIDQWIT